MEKQRLIRFAKGCDLGDKKKLGSASRSIVSGSYNFFFSILLEFSLLSNFVNFLLGATLTRIIFRFFLISHPMKYKQNDLFESRPAKIYKTVSINDARVLCLRTNNDISFYFDCNLWVSELTSFKF